MKKNVYLLLLSVAVLWGSPSLWAASVSTTLAVNGQASMVVRTPAASSDVVKRAANDLAEMLGRLANAKFMVETGDVGSGIVVALAEDLGKDCPVAAHFDRADPFQRDGYLLSSEAGRLWVVGATPQAVEHAVWDLLYRLGYRCYFPGPAWEVIPPAQQTLQITVHAREVPIYAQRQFVNATGSFNSPEWLERWLVRNRMRSSFEPEYRRLFWDYYLGNNQRMAEDPTRLGFSGGNRAQADVKEQFLAVGLCLSHLEQRRELIDYAVSKPRRNVASSSVSASSGTDWNWCGCADCLAVGRPVDRAVALANNVAERLTGEEDLSWTVGLAIDGALAVDNPLVDVHPLVAPRLSAPTLLTLSYTDAEANEWNEWVGTLATPWRNRKARTLAIFCQFGGPSGVTDLSWQAVAKGIPDLHVAGFDGFEADIGQSWGDYGINLYSLARVLWNPGEAKDTGTLAADFLNRCFGPAKEPMKRYFELAGGLSMKAPTPASVRFAPEVIKKRYALLAEALRLTPDPAIRSRIADLVLHTRLWELRGELVRAADGAERNRLSQELMSLAYRGRGRGMAPAKEMFSNPGWYAAGGGKNTGVRVPEGENPWKIAAELTDQEILSWTEIAL